MGGRHRMPACWASTRLSVCPPSIRLLVWMSISSCCLFACSSVCPSHCPRPPTDGRASAGYAGVTVDVMDDSSGQMIMMLVCCVLVYVVCVYMCICAYLCVCVFVCVRACVRTRACVCRDVFAYLFARA